MKHKIVRQWGYSKKAMLIVGYECFENLINEDKLSKAGSKIKQEVLAALVNPGKSLKEHTPYFHVSLSLFDDDYVFCCTNVFI